MNPLRTSPLLTLGLFTAAGVGLGVYLARRSPAVPATLPSGQVDPDLDPLGKQIRRRTQQAYELRQRSGRWLSEVPRRLPASERVLARLREEGRLNANWVQYVGDLPYAHSPEYEWWTLEYDDGLRLVGLREHAGMMCGFVEGAAFRTPVVLIDTPENRELADLWMTRLRRPASAPATLPAGQIDLDPFDPAQFQPALVLPMMAAATPEKWIDKQFTPQQFVDAKKRVLGQIEALTGKVSVNEILASCPDIDEVATIRKLLNIVIESQRFGGSDTMSDCPAAPTMRQKRFYNLFRLAAHLRFGKQIPILEAHSFFDFLRDRNIQITVIDGADDAMFLRPRFPGDLRVTSRLFDGDRTPEDQAWGNGLTGMSARLLLLVQGAFASLKPAFWTPRGLAGPGPLAEYWYAVWLATQAGGLLTDAQQDAMGAYARSIEGLAR